MSQWISANIICSCLVFDFFRSRVVIRFFSPPQRPMTYDFKGFFIPDVIHYTVFVHILILQKEPVLMLSDKQGTIGTILLRVWYDMYSTELDTYKTEIR